MHSLVRKSSFSKALGTKGFIIPAPVGSVGSVGSVGNVGGVGSVGSGSVAVLS